MNRLTLLPIIILAVFFIATSCSDGNAGTLPPVNNPGITGAANHSGQTQIHLWGYYDVHIDTQARTVEAVPNRKVMFTANVVNFINDDPDGLSFHINGTPTGADYIDVDIDVEIAHPFPGMTGYNGYDVRGVFMGDGAADMAYGDDLARPEFGTDQFMLDDPVNEDGGGPDGYTRWFNYHEFSSGGMSLLSYTQGDFASPDFDGTAKLNPCKYFADGLDSHNDQWDFLTGTLDNGVFSAGSSNTRNYYIRFPNDKGVVFGYAIIANWEGTDPVEDHPSNAPEAVACSVVDNSNLYYIDDINNGGTLMLDISLFGWEYQPSTIYIESTVLTNVEDFDPVTIASGGDDHYSTYQVEIPADNVPGLDGNEFWIIAEYGGFDYSNEFGVLNDAWDDLLAAFFRYDLTVSSAPVNQDPVCDLIVVTTEFDKWDEVPVEFDASGSYDPDPGDILTFEWDFDGDELYDEANGDDDWTGPDVEHPIHTYTENYTGVVNLRLTDGNGGVTICTTEILTITLKGCDPFTLPTTGGYYSSGPSDYNTVYAFFGFTITHGGNNRIVGRRCDGTGFSHTLTALDLSETWHPDNCVSDFACDSAYGIYCDAGFACSLSNMCYYVVDTGSGNPDHLRYRLYQKQWNDSTSTWGAYSELPAVSDNYHIYEVAIGDGDLPIVYAVDAVDPDFNQAIFHYNGASWDFYNMHDLPTDYIYYRFGLAWNPDMDHFVFVKYREDTTYTYYINYMYAMDTNGNLVYEEEDIFDFAPDEEFQSDIYIDPESPTCRIFIWGFTGHPAHPALMVRYSSNYANKITGAMDFDHNPNTGFTHGGYSDEMNRIYIPQQHAQADYFDMPPDW